MKRTDGNQNCSTEDKCLLKQYQTSLLENDLVYHLSSSISFSPSFSYTDKCGNSAVGNWKISDTNVGFL